MQQTTDYGQQTLEKRRLWPCEVYLADLLSQNPDVLKKKCMESYAYSAIMVDRNYFDEESNVV